MPPSARNRTGLSPKTKEFGVSRKEYPPTRRSSASDLLRFQVPTEGRRPHSVGQLHVIAVLRRLLADERARFVIVGGVNTAVAYILFLLFEVVFDGRYLLSLLAAYLVATLLAFALHRRFTFGVTGRESVIIDFLRFESVYVVMFLVNAGLLAALVDGAGWASSFAQAVSTIVITVMSYLGHKYFSFRRREPHPDSA